MFAKITPPNIEATTFAFLTGAFNFTNMLSGVVGSCVNKYFVGVTQDDLSNYWVLTVVSVVCGVLPLTFFWLLPTR